MPEPTSETIQVGRQAIFDRDLKLFAYELLYRDPSGGCEFTDGDRASSTTLLNAFMDIGLDRIAGPHRIFVNLTRSFFVDMPPIPFETDRIVLEVLEDVEVDEALLKGIRETTARGIELALDDYAFQPELAPILPMVRYIKVEIKRDGMDELARRMPELKSHGASLLAEKVETAEQFEQLKAMGFDYFQGYFFARPNLVKSARTGENATMVMRLLARLNDPDAPMSEIVDLVRQDPGLSFKVLRYVNSAAAGLRSQVDSIQHAVVLMGLARLRSWATLFAMAGIDLQTSEVLNVGLMRANLCEHLAQITNQGASETAYTIGLLSVLDVILSEPMTDLVEELPLADDVKQALVSREGPYGQLLHAAMQVERNEPLTALPVEEIVVTDLNEAYAASSESAFDTMELLSPD